MKRAAGLTLVELVLALGLLALLMLAVFQLFDRSLAVWRMGETRRALLEVASTVNLELGRDLRGIESGPRGDFVFEWVSFDTDGDGGRETKWPRLRLVRQASAAEVARLQREERIALEPRSAAPSDEPERFERASAALVEVVWMVAPASLRDKDARAEGRLWRGERLVSDATSKSFFDADFFGTSNLPPAGATDEVTGGCLWMNLSFAAQTSVVHDGWRRANDLAGAAATWDAWGRNRPDPGVHPWNERHVGMPAARARPLLPRRVQVELEFERPVDRIRRTRLSANVGAEENVLRVDDGRRIPSDPGSFVLVDTEWMKVESVDGGRVVVRRGERGTTPGNHAKDALVHFGMRLVSEIPVATYREDWDL